MGILDILKDPFPIRAMIFFFVVDIKEEKITIVNAAINEITQFLKNISGKFEGEVLIKIAVLSGSTWLYDELIEINNFYWNGLDACDASDFSKTCKTLNQKLSKSGYMKYLTCLYLRPVIILFSESKFVDNYMIELDNLKNNNWFRCSLKIVISIGDNANIELLKLFADNEEHGENYVLDTFNFEKIKAWFRNFLNGINK